MTTIPADILEIESKYDFSVLTEDYDIPDVKSLIEKAKALTSKIKANYDKIDGLKKEIAEGYDSLKSDSSTEPSSLQKLKEEKDEIRKKYEAASEEWNTEKELFNKLKNRLIAMRKTMAMTDLKKINSRIEYLEHQQAYESLSKHEEEEVVTDIATLKRNRSQLEDLEKLHHEVDEQKKKVDAAYIERKKVRDTLDAAFKVLNEEYDRLGIARSDRDASFGSIKKKREVRGELFDQITALKEERSTVYAEKDRVSAEYSVYLDEKNRLTNIRKFIDSEIEFRNKRVRSRERQEEIADKKLAELAEEGMSSGKVLACDIVLGYCERLIVKFDEKCPKKTSPVGKEEEEEEKPVAEKESKPEKAAKKTVKVEKAAKKTVKVEEAPKKGKKPAPKALVAAKKSTVDEFAGLVEKKKKRNRKRQDRKGKTGKNVTAQAVEDLTVSSAGSSAPAAVVEKPLPKLSPIGKYKDLFLYAVGYSNRTNSVIDALTKLGETEPRCIDDARVLFQKMRDIRGTLLKEEKDKITAEKEKRRQRIVEEDKAQVEKFSRRYQELLKSLDERAQKRKEEQAKRQKEWEEKRKEQHAARKAAQSASK
ncbi:Nuclear segregation protein Bfr1 like protein [Aduncisulcus paluster]|uniref:Nuclear segregation protein Bfr1 like protein n=1 Tax=Aduncisulcus paluster TaxID=2918883 RepID=A0ABQ5KR20_9EUKA|nr:Nuclear segregation protein Bfr1 like protein [Aduncisulcus paluster]